MAKRKKRVMVTKKRKDDDEDNDNDEPVAKKVAVSSSTTFLDEDASQTSAFNVEGVNIGRSDTIGGEVGFSSHFWCNYCDYSSDTKKELVTHMRQHMTKCSYCNFSSLSKAEIAKHVKCEHADEAEKAICEVDSSSSGTEHDMDKDPCSACIFCDFMTYSTEHLEKHTTSKHQGMLPKSVAKMISKQVSARIRKDDAMFYCAISSDNFDKSVAEGENLYSSKTLESNEKNGPIVIEPEPPKQAIDVKPDISPQSPIENQKVDMKPNPHTLSQSNDSAILDQKKDIATAKADDWRVKVETLYCLSCPYSNVAIEKLKCHALTQHPESVAAASFTSEATFRLQDITFYCARESCSYSSVQCGDYEDHLLKCCSPPDSLLYGEKERLKDTIKFVFKCQEKQGAPKSKDFVEFSSQYVSHLYSYETSSPMNSLDTNNQVQTDSISKNSKYSDHATKSHINNSGLNNNIANSGSQSSATPPLIHDSQHYPKNVPEAHTFQNSSNNLSNLTEPQITLRQVEHTEHINKDALAMRKNSSNDFGQKVSASAGDQTSGMQLGQTTMSSNHSNQSMQYQQINNNHQQNSQPSDNFQQIPNLNVHNFQQTPDLSSQMSDYTKSTHNHMPVSTNFNTNTSSSGQQNICTPQPTTNLEPILAPSFDSQFPIMPDGQNHTQSSIIPHQDNQQQQQQAIFHGINSSLTANNQLLPMSTNSYQDSQQQPKMLDLLSDANSVLLDNDISIQSWPTTTQSHDSLPSQTTIRSQSSLHTPPLPQDNDNNMPSFSSNIQPSLSQTSSLPSNFPHSGASSTSTIPSQFLTNTDISASQGVPSHQPSLQNSLTSSETVINVDSPQQTIQNMTSDGSNVISSETPNSQNSTYQSESSTNVPNFLVQSSSATLESITNHPSQPNSFFNNSVPQSPNQQTIPMDYPSTPPSHKNIPPGTSRFPVSNSPLSPSIYLSGNTPRQKRSSSLENSPMQPAGVSPMNPQFRPPHPQGMSLNNQQQTSNVRQRLFTRGQSRGPSAASRMGRPPVNPVDDDVIVTAVVRGPAPHRPPMPGRGRGVAPNSRGVATNARGMTPNARGLAPNARGMVANARGMRGMPPGGRGGRGLPPNMRGMAPRGRAGMPVQRGRGMPRGRGGAIPPTLSPQSKKPYDVSRHFVDLACVVNANEEGEEGDEIQIVGVTPGKGGVPKPKAVDAKKFSYCCIHCGQDQGSKEVMKKHIKTNHSESLLGAFRNVESGQWLYFCPQLTCEFMTYDDNRLTNHLFTCYNLDRSKPLPYDMQSALRNLKSLKIRQEGVGRNLTNPNVGGQGLRDAFNNNLKDAFDDMVENSMGRQLIRPNQPPNQRTPPANRQQPLSYSNQRGALRGPYAPRGTPPKNVRPGFPGPGQMSPGYRQRSPMMGSSPRQPRYPNSPGRPRAPGQPFPTRGMSPGRGSFHPVQGLRLPNTRGGFIPRPNLQKPNMAGNEQSPIIIDLDVDSPGKAPDDNEMQDLSSSTTAPENPSSTPIDTSVPSTNTLVEDNPSYSVDNSTNAIPPSSNLANNPTDMQTVTISQVPNNESTASPTPESFSQNVSQTITHSAAHQPVGPSDPTDNSNAITESDNAGSDTINQTSGPSPANPDPPMDNAQASASTSQANTSFGNVPVPSTDVKDVPSPSQLLAEMNALSSKQTDPQPPSETIPDHTQEEARTSPSQQTPQDGADHNPSPSHSNDEELVNKILLDKVFAKVPHMPKKLSQRLVLKFKKYAADRGMIITPTSRVIDEFVSKISYKGSHSAPTPIGGQENMNSSEITQPAKPSASNNSAMNNAMGVSSNIMGRQEENGSDIDNQNAPSGSAISAPSPGPNQSIKTSSTSLPLAPSITTTNSNSANPSQDSTKSDDVIETKVIFAERKLQFKGAFANIVKEKNFQSNASPSPPLPSMNDNSENSPPEMEHSPQTVPSPADLQSDDRSGVQSTNGSNNTGCITPTTQAEVGGDNTIAKAVKKELIEPVPFPSVSKENSIEVKSSVDHIVCGYASLEVDIAGKPVCASDFTDKEVRKEGYENDETPSPMNKDLSDKDDVKSPCVDSSGTLKFKIKKGNKPRVVFSGKKEDEIVPEKSEDSDSNALPEDHVVRRSVRKRKAVKVDYGSDEMGEMDELMSDEDDEYHVESDESYDASDSDGRGKKKAKKVKSVPDPTAFDLSTKGCFGCWKCTKVFSRVMFLKRHILKKHKEGLCAIVLTETGIPDNDQSSLLLFCPQSCKYVTSNSDAYSSHLDTCTRSPLNIADIDYKSIQETFFKNNFKQLGESIASGEVSTKIPVKPTPVPRKKSLSSPHPPATQTSKSKQDVAGTTTFVTTATIHHPPPQASTKPQTHSQPANSHTHPQPTNPQPPNQPMNQQIPPQPANPQPSPQTEKPHLGTQPTEPQPPTQTINPRPYSQPMHPHPNPLHPNVAMLDPMIPDEGHDGYYDDEGDMEEMLPGDGDPDMFYPEEEYYSQYE